MLKFIKPENRTSDLHLQKAKMSSLKYNFYIPIPFTQSPRRTPERYVFVVPLFGAFISDTLAMLALIAMFLMKLAKISTVSYVMKTKSDAV